MAKYNFFVFLKFTFLTHCFHLVQLKLLRSLSPFFLDMKLNCYVQTMFFGCLDLLKKCSSMSLSGWCCSALYKTNLYLVIISQLWNKRVLTCCTLRKGEGQPLKISKTWFRSSCWLKKFHLSCWALRHQTHRCGSHAHFMAISGPQNRNRRIISIPWISGDQSIDNSLHMYHSKLTKNGLFMAKKRMDIHALFVLFADFLDLGLKLNQKVLISKSYFCNFQGSTTSLNYNFYRPSWLLFSVITWRFIHSP